MSSRIIIIRHAKPEAGAEYTDATRPLCEEGRVIQQKMSQHLSDQGLNAHKILCSPLPRAKETASIVAAALGLEPEVIDALGLDFDMARVLAEIPPPSSNQTLVVVGHEPSMSTLAQSLVGQRFLPAGLRKSGTVVISFEDKISLGSGSLESYFDPSEIL